MLATVVAMVGTGASSALADGDPASDVLAGQPLSASGDAGISPRVQAQLVELLTAAQRGGDPIRVAVIATPLDLGSVGALWGRPQSYARYLALELSGVFHGTLLVVMPGGYGLAAVGRASSRAPAGTSAGLAGAPTPGGGAALGPATEAAILRLASAAGLHLPVPSVAVPAATNATDPAAWAVIIAGAVLIALAWGASVRAAPLGPSRRRASSARM